MAYDFEKMRRKLQYVFPQLPEWWNDQGHDIQAIIKVLTKALLPHFTREIAIGCGNQADIHGFFLDSTQPAKSLVFNYLEQFGLNVDFHFADFIQEERAAVCQFKQSRFVSNSSCKSAFVITEEFRLQELACEIRRN